MTTPEKCVKFAQSNNKNAFVICTITAAFIVNLEQILHMVFVFPLLTLN